MTNTTCINSFTAEFLELLCSGLTAYQALKIMSSSRLSESRLKKTAACLAASLEKGDSLSSAMAKCSFCSFDKTYISFIHMSEMSGNIVEVLSFLNERNIRKEKKSREILNAAFYPLLVVIMTLCLVIALLLYAGTTGNVLELWGLSKGTVYSALKNSTFISIAGFAGGVFCFTKFYSDNKNYEAFLSVGFFMKNGLSLSTAVNLVSVSCGQESSAGKLFQHVREKLEYGMDLKTAFAESVQNTRDRKLISEIERTLLLAGETGDKNEVFFRIAENLKTKDERVRKVSERFMEPVFLLIAGIFILNLVFTLVIPAINNLSSLI